MGPGTKYGKRFLRGLTKGKFQTNSQLQTFGQRNLSVLPQREIVYPLLCEGVQMLTQAFLKECWPVPPEPIRKCGMAFTRI